MSPIARDAERAEAAQLADVAADLVGAVHPGADQLELRMRDDALHCGAADVAGRPLDDAVAHHSAAAGSGGQAAPSW